MVGLRLVGGAISVPRYGDATVAAWVTTLLYFVAAILCGMYANRLKSEPALPEQLRRRAFWWCFTVVIILLGINKQLDLQTWLVWGVRKIARAQGWYRQRRVVQVFFMVGVTVAAVAALVVTRVVLREVWRRHLLALCGMLLLLSFILIRAASFHHVDRLMGRRMGGWRMHWILELAGVCLICLSALINLRRLRDDSAESADRYYP